MSILPPLLFGISASLDALLVGMALGLQKVPLPARHNLLISTVTLIGITSALAIRMAPPGKRYPCFPSASVPGSEAVY